MENIKEQIMHLWTDHKKVVIGVAVVIVIIIIAT
jgi:hypothetical protein